MRAWLTRSHAPFSVSQLAGRREKCVLGLGSTPQSWEPSPNQLSHRLRKKCGRGLQLCSQLSPHLTASPKTEKEVQLPAPGAEPHPS